MKRKSSFWADTGRRVDRDNDMTVAGQQPGLAPAGALRPEDATKEERSSRCPGVVVLGA